LEYYTKMNETRKILFYDIETSPSLGYVWGKWETNVMAYKEHWGLLCFSFKWQGGKTEVMSLRTHKTEKRLVKELWNLFNEADIIIAHNGKSFDTKKSNALFVRYGLTPPSPYKQIDTKVVAKKYFKFDSNKLDDLGDFLNIGRKMQTGGFELWLGCMNNNEKSWRLMEKYNIQDVVLLEKVYEKLSPYIENYPILRKDYGKCPRCQSEHLQSRGRWKFLSGDYKRLQCQSCGHWFKGDKM
jgi:uncharacterized protein YprB with RNaseH-like and TPR domain